ncbi:DUF4240 domain-containing protein [Mucilaginibacter gotjawali]|uniref:DUF4240 domain-containing protein n=2 Tax=Mucilaginibacter gotjawali TaxID=1550579 RepID=A0A0X8X6S3_9SPHI|nr:DUF4240 domain-containing protein [Mucilaginibacter gotjawali]MBB3056979.1 hypothetical protein [Mucilaginibacter gotjawali]BAU56058.1 hypothetical protein MgSA37_04250 [Mucilaginibacter gotjawali]
MSSTAIQEGDIHHTILRDGRFGAVRVLKTGGKFGFSPYTFHLIGVTAYIGEQPPIISDPRLTEILITEYIYPKGKSIINIYCGKFPKQLKYVGNIPISCEESNFKIEIGNGIDGGFPSCGKIPQDIGYEILIEWRYKYDNFNFVKEIEISRKEHEEFMKSLHVNKPKRMLDDARFWDIISMLDWSQQGNDEKVLEPAAKALSKLKPSEIKSFEETLANKLFQIDTKEHAKNIGEYSYDEKEQYMSVDSFLYARCAAVANGKALYEKIKELPTEMVKDVEFEALLSLSAIAYELKTGREIVYDAGVSYETYANKEGWT